MKGFPKNINSKQDVYNVKDQYPEETKAFLQTAIESREGWVQSGKLRSRSDGVENETERIVAVTDENGDDVEWYQETWGVLPGNILDRIGLTVEEAQTLTKG